MDYAQEGCSRLVALVDDETRRLCAPPIDHPTAVICPVDRLVPGTGVLTAVEGDARWDFIRAAVRRRRHGGRPSRPPGRRPRHRRPRRPPPAGEQPLCLRVVVVYMDVLLRRAASVRRAWMRRPAGVAAAVALCATAPASAAAAWSEPFRLDPANSSATDVQVRLDERGAAVFSWGRAQVESGASRIMGRTLSTAGALQPLASPSGPGLFVGSELASAPSGAGVVAWTRSTAAGDDRVQASARAANGTRGRVFDVSAPGDDAILQATAVGRDGAAVFVWSHLAGHHDTLRARLRLADGRLGPVVDMPEPRVRDVGLLGAAMLPGGDALIVWQHAAVDRYRVYARAISAHRAPSPIVALSALGSTGDVPAVGVSARGDALVAWRTTGGRVQSRVRHASGRLAPIVELAPADPSFDPAAPVVAVAPSGRAAVVWTQGGRHPAHVLARLRSAHGGFGPPIELSIGVGVVARPEVALDAAGAAVVAWSSAADDEDATDRILLARRLSATGRPGALDVVSNPHGSAFTFPGGLAVGRRGQAVITWVDWDYVQNVGVSFGPARAAVLPVLR